MSRVSGFRPLKPGCIHLRCPQCGRKQSNMPRDPEFDHPTAYLVEDACEKCGSVGFGPEFFDKRGRSLSPWAFYNKAQGRRGAERLGPGA